MMEYDAFISYCRRDAKRDGLVFEIEQRLIARNLKPWIDKSDLHSRDCAFNEAIAKAVQNSSRFLLFVGSDAKDSSFVESELKYARIHGCKVIPILYAVKPEDMEDKLSLIPERYAKKHIYDFSAVSDPTEKELLIENLIADITYPIKLGELSSNFKSLPPDYIPRDDYILSMEQHLFANSYGVSKETIGGFYGKPGIGKSVLANAFCRDAEIRSQFPDGILWVDVRENGSLSSVMQQIRLEHPEIPDKYEEQEVKLSIKKFFSEKSILVILDDVWEEGRKIVDIFYNIFSGTANKVIVTSRNSNIISTYTSCYDEINYLSDAEAEKMMLSTESKSGYDEINDPGNAEADKMMLSTESKSDTRQLDDNAKQIIAKLKGHTLSIAIVCAMHRDGLLWRSILDRLNTHRELIKAILPDYRYIDAYSAIAASVEHLKDKTSYYKKLAVFPKENGIPIAAAATLWSSIRPDLDTVQAEAIALELHRKCLVTYDQSKSKIILHDLEVDYLQTVVPGIDHLHAEFADMYQKNNHGIWSAGKDDHYYYQHIIYHMLRANNEYIGIAGELLSDYAWIKKKLAVCGCKAVLSDYDLAKKMDLPDREQIQLIGKCLFLSAAFLTADYRQLPTHLVGRLIGIDQPVIKRLLNQIDEQETDFWLRPTARCMLPPDSNMLNQWTVFGNPSAMAVSDNMLAVASAKKDEAFNISRFDLGKTESEFTWISESPVLSLCIDGNNVISSDSAGNVLKWTVGDPKPAAILAANDNIKYMARLSSGGLIFVSDTQILVPGKSGFPLDTVSKATAHRLVNDELFIGFSDGYIRKYNLTDGSHTDLKVTDRSDLTIRDIAAADHDIACELVANIDVEDVLESQLVLIHFRFGKPMRPRVVFRDNRLFGGLHFASDKELLFCSGIYVYSFDISSETPKQAAMNEHWITCSAVSNRSIVCIDHYGHIRSFDLSNAIVHSFNAYDSYPVRTMIDTECFGSLERGIRGVPVSFAEKIKDPDYRIKNGIAPVVHCMAMTPEGIVYADLDNGPCFFRAGEKQPLKAGKGHSKPLCAACYLGLPMIGFEDGSIILYTREFHPQAFYHIASGVDILCTENDSVFCASGNTIIKINADKSSFSTTLPMTITHLHAAGGYVFLLFGDHNLICLRSDDFSGSDLLSADLYNLSSPVTSSFSIGGYIVFFTEDGNIYYECIGDFQLEYQTRHNIKDRKIFCLGTTVLYCGNSNDRNFALFAKELGSMGFAKLDEITSSVFLTITSIGRYVLTGSQQDEMCIWDIYAEKPLRRINTDSILRQLAVIGDHIAFVSGSHFFWLKIENLSMIEHSSPFHQEG